MIKRLSRNNDGLPSGGAIGESGYNLTFTIAYLRDFAMTYGLLSESFETFAPWSKVDDVIRRTIDRVCREHAIRALPGKPFVSSRITQLYDEGACIYFYLCLYVDGVENPHVVFAEIEHAAREEILLCGATLSHHHGIGKLRSNFMDRINSVVFDDVLKEVKKSFDPDNVLIGNGSYYTN
jgi:alkyldihydroxyacetonephosphate synthase